MCNWTKALPHLSSASCSQQAPSKKGVTHQQLPSAVLNDGRKDAASDGGCACDDDEQFRQLPWRTLRHASS